MTGVSPLEHRDPRLHPLLAGDRPQGADHQRREARARGVEHGRVRRPDERHLRPVGHLPGRARERAPRLGPVQRLPVLGERAAARRRLPRRARGVGPGDAPRGGGSHGLRGAARLPALAVPRGVPPPRGREEGRPVRPPGDRAAADPRARPRSTTASPREWIAKEKPDLAIVYFQGTDSIGHAFAPFAPPRQPTVSEEDYARYSGVPELYFRHVDTLLGAYRALARGDGAPSSCSPRTTASSGTRGDRRSCRASPTRPPASGTARTASTSRGARASLPRPATRTAPARRRSRPPCSRSSACRAAWGWRSRCCRASPPPAGKAVRYAEHYRPAAPAATASVESDAEAIEKLKALGYIGAGEATLGAGRGGGEHAHGRLVEQRGPRAARRGPQGGLGRRVREGARARPEPRVGAVEPERRAEPAEARAGPLGRPAGAGLRDGPRPRPAASWSSGRSSTTGRATGRAASACWTPPCRPATTSPRRGSSAAATASSPGDCRGALADFRRATALAPASAAGHASEGLAHLCLGDRAAARRSLERSLQLDPQQPRVREFLSRL